MNSGLMDVLITIKSPTYTDSDFGKAAKPSGYSTVKSIYARVQYNGGSETTAADKKEYRENATLTVHHLDGKDIAMTDIVEFDTKSWNITSKNIINRNQYIRLEAVTVD